MEQKLSEYRARKRTEVASKCRDIIEPQMEAKSKPAAACSEPVAYETRLKEGKTELSSKAVTTATQRLVDWLLHSTLGRKIGLQRLAVTNLLVLKLLLWLVLLGLFCEIDFGLPFFLISLFYWLYEGLRSPSVRQAGELSAYSVFNPDCQQLLGTLTAQQLEGEMGYRPLANR